MKTKKIYIVFLLLIGIFYGCDKTKNPIKSDDDNQTVIQFKNIVIDNPENISDNITLDMYGNVWYVTIIEDTSITVDPHSSCLPSITQIYKYDYKNHHLVYDNIKEAIYEIAFDDYGNIWLMNSKEIMKIDKHHSFSKVLSLGEKNGLFQSIAIDQDNNVWVVGLNTGIYKYSNGEWQNFNADNSQLPCNSMTKIFIDKNNIVWIALWDLEGILKIENTNWDIYNNGNSDISLDNIWEIEIDDKQQLWIGTGSINPDITLICFDGKNWFTKTPQDFSGNNISGTIRDIEIDLDGKIWTVSRKVENSHVVNTTLSIYYNQSWKIIDNVAEGKIITDIEHFNNKIVLATYDQLYLIE